MTVDLNGENSACLDEQEPTDYWKSLGIEIDALPYNISPESAEKVMTTAKERERQLE